MRIYSLIALFLALLIVVECQGRGGSRRGGGLSGRGWLGINGGQRPGMNGGRRPGMNGGRRPGLNRPGFNRPGN